MIMIMIIIMIIIMITTTITITIVIIIIIITIFIIIIIPFARVNMYHCCALKYWVHVGILFPHVGRYFIQDYVNIRIIWRLNPTLYTHFSLRALSPLVIIFEGHAVIILICYMCKLMCLSLFMSLAGIIINSLTVYIKSHICQHINHAGCFFYYSASHNTRTWFCYALFDCEYLVRSCALQRCICQNFQNHFTETGWWCDCLLSSKP